MSVFDVISDYVKRMLNSSDASGMKALILDKETTGIFAMTMSQSSILEKQVFIVERIDVKTKQDMNHLKAIVFVRPTKANITLLCDMLRSPGYVEFHLFFSNILPTGFLRKLAEADMFDVVCQVQEFYADVLPISDSLFSLNLPYTSNLHEKHWNVDENDAFQRIVDGIVALLLSFKIKPIIRTQAKSTLCKRVADSVQRCILESGDLFSFGSRAVVDDESPLLLILDRREDPITPLLHQWIYQGMVHELLTISNNRVDLRHVSGARKDMKEIVLSASQDTFFKESSLLNFGDLGLSVKKLVEEYQRKTKSERNIDSIEDMQRVVENYSEYIQESSLVSKHVALVTELSHIVDRRHLMDVSALQQSLACENNHTEALQATLDMIKNVSIVFEDKLRIVMLYALRYESQQTEIMSMCALLRDRADTQQEREGVETIRELLRVAGVNSRSLDLYSDKDIFAKAQRFISTGLQGVENIYTRHQPLLARTIEQLRKARLKPTEYPYVTAGDLKHSTKTVFIFIVGGATYEEAAFIARLNKQSSENKYILGGTFIHNSQSYIADLLPRSLHQHERHIDIA